MAGFNFGSQNATGVGGIYLGATPTGFNFGAQNATGVGGISLSSTPSAGFTFTQTAQAPQTQTFATKEHTVTNPKAWISILAHSSYHDLQEMSIHGKKIDTLLIASLGSCSKMEIQPTATAFDKIATSNTLVTTPHEILRQFNDVVKIKITPEEEEEGRRQSPEKLEKYLRWIHDPGMISLNRDVYYEKWYNFTYGFKIDGFVKIYIELDSRPQIIDISISTIPGYPTPTKTQLLQHVFSLYPTLQDITFIDLCCTKLSEGMTPYHFKPGILGGTYSISSQNRRSRSQSTRPLNTMFVYTMKSNRSRKTRKSTRKVKCAKGYMNCSKCKSLCSMCLVTKHKKRVYACSKCDHVINK